MTGTFINAGAIIVGSTAGILLNARLPRRVTDIVFQGLGLFTLYVGFSMAFRTSHMLLMIFSIVLGSILGELMGLESGMERVSEKLKTRLKSSNEKFTEGMITAFLLYCMGSMTILGAFEEGLGGEPNLLLAKSVLDGFSSVALASALGLGVLFSVIPLLIYQGGLTLLAAQLQDLLTEVVVDELSAVGGLLLIGLGINILEIRRLRIMNMLPALVIIVVLTLIFV
ncbi:MAG: DUF554 family protein [Spirochaetes bacterium]|jgi:uncharacterized membrane protein YqgA involved in biofilm formation|nr:DUF554 family protein [Spirochaetota bacterium]